MFAEDLFSPLEHYREGMIAFGRNEGQCDQIVPRCIQLRFQQIHISTRRVSSLVQAECLRASSRPGSKAFGRQVWEACLAEAFTPLSRLLLVIRVGRFFPL